jgi:hypothetical protein
MTEPSCCLPECDKPPRARGWCHNHYSNWHRTGNPVAIRSYVKGGRTCDFPECGKPHDSNGLCRGHVAQRDAGRPLSPLGEYRRTTDRDDQGRKQCRDCDEWFPPADFTRRASTADGLNTVCGPCDRNRKMRIMYGITTDDYARLLDEQGGCCAICGRVNESGVEYAVDHDHACCPGRNACGKCVRGLLCSPCNTGLGMFRDDPEVLGAAAAYLRRQSR